MPSNTKLFYLDYYTPLGYHKGMKSKKGTSHSSQTNSLKKVEGQVRGVIQMVEDKRYCIDILHQIKAIKSALSTIERNISDQHFSHCFESALQSKDSKKSQEMLEELRLLLKATIK